MKESVTSRLIPAPLAYIGLTHPCPRCFLAHAAAGTDQKGSEGRLGTGHVGGRYAAFLVHDLALGLVDDGSRKNGLVVVKRIVAVADLSALGRERAEWQGVGVLMRMVSWRVRRVVIGLKAWFPGGFRPPIRRHRPVSGSLASREYCNMSLCPLFRLLPWSFIFSLSSGRASKNLAE